jgi:hypothetical protein
MLSDIEKTIDMPVDEHGFIRLLTEGLESGTLLPQKLRAKVRHESHLGVPDGRHNVDLVIEFTISGTGATILVIGECIMNSSPSKIIAATHQLRVSLHYFANHLKVPEVHGLIASPSMSESSRQLCKQADIGFIDLVGNFFLSAGPLYFDIAKARRVSYPMRRGTRNLYRGKSKRVLKILLSDPLKPAKLKDVSKIACCSVGQVSYVLQELRSEGLAEKIEVGTVLKKPGRLLKMLAGETKRDYEKQRKIFHGFSTEKSPDLMERLSAYCEARGLDYAFALMNGLESHERNLIEEMTAIYVSGDPDDIARDLNIPFAHIGANVFIMRPPSSDNTSAGGVFYDKRRLSNGIPAVNLIQSYLDFSLYPGRGKEQANFIFNRLLGFRD